MIDEVLVNIVMVTHNQEKYIARAIESVLMQNSKYKYKLIISDDCSSDNTFNICRNYLDKNPETINLLNSNINNGIAANYKNAFAACTAKYTAILEGDDFWIDRNKLQKQIDILENNNKIGLVHTNYKNLQENGEETIGHLFVNKKKMSGKIIDDENIVAIGVAPLTACFRTELVKENVDFDFLIRNNLLTVDIMFWAEIAHKSEIFYIDEVTSIYRVLSTSITNSTNIEKIEIFNKSSDTINLYIYKKYGTSEKSIRILNSNSARFMVKEYLERKMYEKAKKRSNNLIINNFENLILYIFSNYSKIIFFYRIIKRIKHLFNKHREKLIIRRFSGFLFI